MGKGTNFLVLFVRTILPKFPHVRKAGSSPNPVVQGFLWKLYYIGMVD